MKGRGKLALGVAAAVGVGVVLLGWQLRDRPPSDCATVRSLIDYNSEFSAQAKTAGQDGAATPLTTDQYREWAERIRTYASQIGDPTLSGRAQSAAALAGETADLVPKYRAKPDDPAIAGEYAGIGIRYGNTITLLEYLCPAG